MNNFLIAKPKAYGFSDYLRDRKQRTSVNNSFSDFIELLLVVPQGSVLGPLFFKYLHLQSFLFVEEDNVSSYAYMHNSIFKQ